MKKLIIESNKDPLVSEELRNQIKTTYQDAKIYTFDKKGHFPYLNEAQECNQVLLDFLN